VQTSSSVVRVVKHPEPIVFVVDDDASMREALASLLGSLGMRVVCFASAQEFLQHPRPGNPACLVLDVRMPGLSGLDLQRELAIHPEPIPIIFITAHGDIPMAVGAMKAGAVEFLSKPFREQDLLQAIQRAVDRDRAAGAQRAELAAIRARYGRLTPREREVFGQVVRGRLNKQTAAELGVSEITVKAHRRHIMQKMGAATFAELVLMGWRLRLY
jgi:FixJ family two-component response regulator